MAKPRTAKPPAFPDPGTQLGAGTPPAQPITSHPGTVPEGLSRLAEAIAGPRHLIGTPAPLSPPPIPRTAGLRILRTPGGYILFDDAEGGTSDPEYAIAVAATGPDLLARIADWTRPADPAPTPGEAA